MRDTTVKLTLNELRLVIEAYVDGITLSNNVLLKTNDEYLLNEIEKARNNDR